MDRKLFDTTPSTYTEWIDEPDNTVTIVTHEDVEPVIDSCNRRRNDHGSKLTHGKLGELHKVADIPPTLYAEWIIETNGAILKDMNLLKMYLNNPDYKHLRTSPINL